MKLVTGMKWTLTHVLKDHAGYSVENGTWEGHGRAEPQWETFTQTQARKTVPQTQLVAVEKFRFWISFFYFGHTHGA